MVLYIKNKYIFNISLNKWIFLSEVVTVNHLQRIRDIHCLPALMHLRLYLWVESIYNFMNVLAYNHAIELVKTSAGMYVSTSDRWTIEINAEVLIDFALV